MITPCSLERPRPQHRALALVAISALLLAPLACEKMPLLAPTDSTITIYTAQSVVGMNGSTEVIALVLEPAGTPVQNGTVVTFATTVGTMDPVEARTTNGRAKSILKVGNVSGTAVITAMSGNASATLENILIGAAAAADILLSANPSAVPASGGTVMLTAVIVDQSGNRLVGVPVNFSTTAGSLSQSVVTSDEQGEARTQLTTSQSAQVTAVAGGLMQTLDITATPLPIVTITTAGGNVQSGQPVVFTLNVQAGQNGSGIREVTVDYGDGHFENLGSTTGTTSVTHVFNQSGTFKVTATATDMAGQTGTAVSVVFVAEVTPIQVGVTAGAAAVNQPVSFTATVTGLTNAAIKSVVWDFGDGTQATTTGLTTSHVYTTPGRRVIRVTVQATNGATGLGQTEIVIS